MNDAQANAADQSGEAGFTLAEVLIALALTALILSFVSAMIGSGLKAWKASTELDRAAQIYAVRNFLRDRLAAVAPARVRDSDRNLNVVFVGSGQRLDFASMMPEGHVKAGLYKVSLYLVPDDGSDALRRTSALAIDMVSLHEIDAAPSAQTRAIILLTRVETFGIRYFGKRAERERADWHDSWERGATLPSLIQIEVRAENDSSAIPALLTIETKLNSRPN